MAISPVEIEGPIASVERVGDDAVLMVMGMKVVVTKAAATNRRIVTPDLGRVTRNLSIEQLTRKAKLPGRESEGFVGGTAIVTGNYDPAKDQIEVTFEPSPPGDQGLNPFEEHPKLEVGPPESLILGPLTSENGAPFEVNGVPIELVGTDDDRLRGLPPQNEFGFELELASIKKGMPVAVDGYPTEADPTKFRGLNFVVDAPTARLVDARSTRLKEDVNQVSILRASGRNRGAEFDVNIRGGVYVSGKSGGSQTIDIFRIDKVDGNEERKFLGRAQAPILPNGFGKWLLKTSLTAQGAPYDVAPSIIVAQNVDDPTPMSRTARKEDIDVRDG